MTLPEGISRCHPLMLRDNKKMAIYVYQFAGQKPKAMTSAWPHPWFRQLAKERGIKLK